MPSPWRYPLCSSIEFPRMRSSRLRETSSEDSRFLFHFDAACLKLATRNTTSRDRYHSHSVGAVQPADAMHRNVADSTTTSKTLTARRWEEHEVHKLVTLWPSARNLVDKWSFISRSFGRRRGAVKALAPVVRGAPGQDEHQRSVRRRVAAGWAHHAVRHPRDRHRGARPALHPRNPRSALALRCGAGRRRYAWLVHGRSADSGARAAMLMSIPSPFTLTRAPLDPMLRRCALPRAPRGQLLPPTARGG
jgi:hypothetical protein